MGRSLSQLPNRLSTFNAADRFYVVRGTSNYYTTYADLSSAFGGGGGGVPTEITVADEAADTTCFPAFFTAATGDLGPKTNSGLTFNAQTGYFGAAGFEIPISGGDIQAGSQPLLRFTTDPVSSDEFIVITAGFAGDGPVIQSEGSAQDVDLTIVAKNSGNLSLRGATVKINQKTISLSEAFTTTGTSGITLAAPSTGSPITYTLPVTDATLARTDAAQTFTGTQTFGAITSTADQTFSDTGEGVIFHGSGKISGASGAVTIAASGTNQSITLTPSGTGRVSLPTGGSAAAVSTGYSANTGFFGSGSGIAISYFGTGVVRFIAGASGGGSISSASGAVIGWESGTVGSGNVQTAFSQISAGVAGLGTGTAGSTAGELRLTNLTASGVVYLGTYTVGTLPTATVRGFIYVSNESGGAVPAFADGTNWRRVTDRAIVS